MALGRKMVYMSFFWQDFFLNPMDGWMVCGFFCSLRSRWFLANIAWRLSFLFFPLEGWGYTLGCLFIGICLCFGV